MEKTYFVQRQTMSSIADEVRTLSGEGIMMMPETMREELVEANDAVVEQDGIMNEIRDILSSKRIPEETLEGLDEYVDFYDYDGTLLHRYTVLEIMGMDELPPLPSHEGLICQGWNWTLEQLKDEHGGVDVAPFYRTDTGDTRVYVEIPYDGFKFVFNSVSVNVEIDFGDGSDKLVYKNSVTKTYEKKGKYVISFKSASPYYLNSAAYPILAGLTGNPTTGSNLITAIECGDNLRFYNGAFYNLSVLKTITQTAAINNVRQLCYNSGLKLIILGKTLGGYALYRSTARCIFSHGTNSMDESFDYFFNGTGRIPRSFSASYRYGFSQSPGVFKIFRPKSINTIGERMFQNAKFETVICNPSHIDVYAFSYSYIKNIIIQNENTSLSEGAFTECEAERIEIQNTNSIPRYCFQRCRNLRHIVLPDAVVSIGDQAFNGSSLRDVKLPDSLKTIGESAFQGTDIGPDLIMPDTVTSIGARCFQSCYRIEKLKLSKLLTTIPTQAFNYCSIREVKIPGSVLYIESNAFSNCNNLLSIDFTDHKEVPTIADAGSVSSTAVIYVPSALYNDWIVATNWSSIKSRIVPV